MKFSSLLAGSALIASALAVDVDPIVIKGKKFFYKTNGTEFFMRGVAYQQDISTNGTASGSNSTDYQDPLADATACKRDIPLMKELQTNVIRVYAINPDSDHTECMNLLMENGIYVVSDLSEPSTSINRAEPKWDIDLYNRYTSVVDELQKYNNVIGFFAGNEVSNTMSNTNASAFVKAAVRDMKAYIKQKNYRSMGVGYATNDDKDIRVDLANYFNCGTEETSIDFWGYNVYSWCGKSTYEESGYKDRTEELTDYSVPAFFAEYGCNEVQPRLFTEVQALFGSEMTPVWSGGIVYMWFQEANDYGLVSISNGEASKLTDFENLSTEMASATPTGVNSASYTPTATALQSCPAVAAGAWSASSDLPPTPNEALCGCMYDSLSCVVKDSVSSSDYSDLFGTVCGYANAVPGVCDGINTNGTSGKYGAYSMCQTKEQVAWILDVYYKAQKAKGNAASACDFGGSATLKSATSATASCSSLLQQAGSAGTGTVTSAPTGTGSSGSSGSSGSTSSGAAFPMASPQHVSIGGVFQLGIYIATAVLAGAGMILL